MAHNQKTVRIAMWSGPRNISTAMMRSFENRVDCMVVDEPFYAYYLYKTRADHPSREMCLAAQSHDTATIIKSILRPLDEGAHIFYQKHMTHHMVGPIDLSWLRHMQHAFLIRDPRAIIASYLQKRPQVILDDIGLIQQIDIFQRVADATGVAPPVIETTDVLKNPSGMMQALCAALGIPFDLDMLAWPTGPRKSDGAWAPHWYDSVNASTGFMPYRPTEIVLSPEHERLAERALPLYEQLATYKLEA